MRVVGVVSLAVMAALVGCGTSQGGPGAAGPWADLKIAYWADGRDEGKPLRWTLRCGPAGGTLPRAAAACRRLQALKRPFAPVPKDMACTEIYGGPGEVVVSGTLRGKRVWALFSRRDGCQIERWNTHAFLWGGRSGGAP